MLHFFAGWLGASVSCVLLSPLEVVKTRQQSSLRVGAHLRADQLALHIVRTEGVRGLYRGLTPHLLGVGPSRAFYFGGYSLIKQRSEGGALWQGRETLLHLYAASVASIASATIMSPMWVVKTRLQLQAGESPAAPPPPAGGARGAGSGSGNPLLHTQAPARYKGIGDAFRTLYREEGVLAFYRGLSASYLGVIETTLQFVLYGEMKKAVMARRLRELEGEVVGGRAPPLPKDKGELRRLLYDDSSAFWTSAGAKLVAAVATYPHEVLRTRMREGSRMLGENKGAGAAAPRYSGLIQTVSLIVREEGVRGLYGGMGVHLLRTVPNAAILLLVVEKITGGEV